ncbi:formyl transferase family protein [Burkholderia thailandensis]|uniref:phosphoribosylglycinamide formyltransferase 1 n=1 Tax=Burkholderia thailandensis TaxID=57975 RepID=A0AAW9CV59_BURTH|nr:formyl transferase family protein [Burkholderia thailandensis]
MKKIVILISGRGSNMEAIVRACAREGWPAEVAAVISNRPGAAGLEFAAAHGIATAVVDHRAFDGRDSFDAALAAEVDRFAPISSCSPASCAFSRRPSSPNMRAGC